MYPASANKSNLEFQAIQASVLMGSDKVIPNHYLLRDASLGFENSSRSHLLPGSLFEQEFMAAYHVMEPLKGLLRDLVKDLLTDNAKELQQAL